MEIKITIPLTPVTKKNSGRILRSRDGKPFIAPSAKYAQYERDCRLFVRPLGISGPVNVRCVYYMPTRRNVDLTNLLEATMDVLVKYGTITDDNAKIVQSHDGSLVYFGCENPRTEITITEASVCDPTT